MAAVVTTSGTFDLEMSGFGTELPQGKSLDLRNVITALCCNSESALSYIPTGIKNNVYFVCKSSGLDLDFADDCTWATGSSVHRSLYVCLQNNALKRVAYKDKLYVFPQLSGGRKTIIPLDPQPSHEDILEIHTRNFCHSESSDYKKRITWISKLPIRIWPVLPKTACVEYLGTSPEVPPSETESYQYVVQEDIEEVQDGAFCEPGNTQDLEQLHVENIGESYDLKNCNGPANGNFIDDNISCEVLNYEIPVLNLADIESRTPQDLPYEPVYVSESVKPDEFVTQPLYFYVSPNCSTNSIASLIPVDRVADREEVERAFELGDSRVYETDLSQLYADISAKHKDNVGSKCSPEDESPSLIDDSLKDGTPLLFGKFLDLKNIIHAFQSYTSLIKIPRGVKKNAYYIVKKNEKDECCNPLSKCYEDEFAWVGCHEKSETFCRKENNEFERLSLGKKNVPRSIEEEILIVRRSYGSAKAPVSLRKRITSITKAPSSLHASISQAVCVEYVGNLEGPIHEEEADSCGMEGGSFLPLESTLICGFPLPEGTFLDINSLLAALVSGKSASFIPKGAKEDVYFICNESSNLFCRETGEISPTLDEFGQWYTSHSVIVTFVVDENGSHERCYLEDDLYYRRKRKGDNVIYELFHPQPSSRNILEINRNHSSAFGLWRRITWVIRAPGFLCSVVPTCACVEYLGSQGNGFLPNKCEHNAVDRGHGEGELACLEGLPLPEGKFLSPWLLLQALRNARLVEQIPTGLKKNVYFIIGIERVKDLRSDKDWCSGNEVTHEIYYLLPESTSCVRIFKKRGFYCAKKNIPLLPQPSHESILEIDRHTSTWRESTLYKRQISWITKLPSHVAPFGTNLACVEYVMDGGVSLESVGESTNANKQTLDSRQNLSKNVATEKEDIIQLHSVHSVSDTDNLSLGDSISIPDFIKRNFVRHVGYDEKGEVDSLILYTEEQILDLCRFCCSRFSRSVLGVKTLFKDQGFNVTVLTYTNYSVIHVPTGKHPLFIGPVFIHKNENVSAYNLFFLHMKDTFSKTHDIVRNGRKNPLVWGSDLSRTVHQSLAHVYARTMRLVCVEHLKSRVREVVMKYPNKSSESKERILQFFVGPEGVCSSCSEKELESRITMIQLLGEIPAKLLLEFKKSVYPILKRNFATHVRHPWIEPLWVNGSIWLELPREVSKSSDLLHEKAGEKKSHLEALVNNLYGCVEKQVTELFNVLTKESDVLTLSKEFKMHMIDMHSGSFQTKKQVLEKFWVFLGARNFDGKFKTSKPKKMSGKRLTVSKSTANRSILKSKTAKKRNTVIESSSTQAPSVGENLHSGHSSKESFDEKEVASLGHENVKKGSECSPNSKRRKRSGETQVQQKITHDKNLKRNTKVSMPLNGATEDSFDGGTKRRQTSKKRKSDQMCEPSTSMYNHDSLLGEHDENVEGLQGKCLEKKESEPLVDNNSNCCSEQLLTEESVVEVVEPKLQIQRENEASKVRDNKTKFVNGNFPNELKRKITEVGSGDSNCDPGQIVDSGNVKNRKVSEHSLLKAESKSDKISEDSLPKAESKSDKISEDSLLKVESKSDKISEDSLLKVESNSEKSVGHKKASTASGKLGGKRVVKCLKGQQRGLSQKKAAQTKGVGRCGVTHVKKPRIILKKIKCNPNQGSKQVKKRSEKLCKESRKRKRISSARVISDESRHLDKRELGISGPSDELKYVCKEEICLRSVLVRLEVLPQKTLRTLLEEGRVLLSAK
ncbi:uncharacterized protein [Palaemon carinicauda]|uniref:uncharacterized protein n=1 Tax=Palaemon carinicauda TaxID=392227 RepID=UPI0035B5DA48